MGKWLKNRVNETLEMVEKGIKGREERNIKSYVREKKKDGKER